jgi:hypothetical protein
MIRIVSDTSTLYSTTQAKDAGFETARTVHEVVKMINSYGK